MREFRRLLLSIANQLTQTECNELVYIYDLPEQFYDKRALTVLKCLKAVGLLTCSQPEKLIEILMNINRVDLSMRAMEFISKHRKNIYQSDSASMRLVRLGPLEMECFLSNYCVTQCMPWQDHQTGQLLQ